MPAGLLVVERIWANPENIRISRKPALPLSVAEIGRRYRGIDGRPWPGVSPSKRPLLVDGLAALQDVDRVNRYRAAACPLSCDLIYIVHPHSDEYTLTPAGYAFLGFDFGFYESEWSVYSVIFHEVIYGWHDRLRVHAGGLNDSLLAPSLDLVRGIEASFLDLLREGADLETGTMVPIRVYGGA
jgi:hypothetical protein